MIGAERFYTSPSADVHIRVSNPEGGLAERSVRWLSPRDHPDVTQETIRRTDLVADLYLPRSRQGPVPVVIVVGGSGGGFNSERASLLATHGYAALDVAYFGAEGTPRYFVETLPLEYFMGAVSFLENDPRIDASRIAVMGKSYGAQLALLLASYEPRIHLVIAEAPSSFTTGTPATYPVGPVLSAWSLEGEAFPFLNAQDEGKGPVSPKQITVSTSGEVALEQEPAAKRAAIPVERINGPVLLISGEEDNIWPSTVMTEQLIRRMKAHEFEHAARHGHYPDAGHNLGGGEQAYGVPNLPPKDRGGSSGGTRQGNSVAGVAAWEEVLAFLRSHL
jgi:dienelactone hydrolase